MPNTTREEFIQHEFSRYYNIKASNWKGSTWFAAAEHKDRPGRCFALIVLTRKEGDWWYKKSMDESCGPYETGASRSVRLNLSPVDELYEKGSYSHQWATEWRKRQEELKPKPVKTGQWIKIESPIRFSNGKTYDEFQKIERNRWYTRDGASVRMNLLNTKYELISHSDEPLNDETGDKFTPLSMDNH